MYGVCQNLVCSVFCEYWGGPVQALRVHCDGPPLGLAQPLDVLFNDSGGDRDNVVSLPVLYEPQVLQSLLYVLLLERCQF